MLKQIVQSSMPARYFEKIQATRSRRYQLKLLEEWGVLEATKRFVEKYGTVVRSGPFAGLIYPLDAALSRHSIPKILGTYEQELHSVISLIAARQYETVIDIGSAEGYYAVGLARLLKTQVLAYEPEPKESSLCSSMAKLNGLSDLVKMRTLFNASDIEGLKQSRALVICDCEGFEEEIFTKDTVAATGKWDLLIELHGTAATTLPHLSWPQRCCVIEGKARNDKHPDLEGIGDSQQLLSEFRGTPQTWLWCDSTGLNA